LKEHRDQTKIILLKDLDAQNLKTFENAIFAFIELGFPEILPEMEKT